MNITANISKVKKGRSYVIIPLLLLGIVSTSCGRFFRPTNPETTVIAATGPEPAVPPNAPSGELIEQKPELDSGLLRELQPQMESMPEKSASRRYNIVLLLPFMTDLWDGGGRSFQGVSRWSLHFYSGVKMALEALDQEGPELSVAVLDTKASDAELGQLLRTNKTLADAHLIIGPYRRTNIQEVAEFVRTRDMIQISPYSAASGMTRQNPHYIQMRPSLETHCAALVRHALENYRPEQLVLIGRQEALDGRTMAAMQEAYYTWAGSREAPPLSTQVIDGPTFTGGGMSALLSGRDTAVFLVSAWQAADERFVYSFLRNLDLSRRAGQQIVVYGTPVWSDFDRIDLDYFEKFHVHISNYSYLDRADPVVAEFRRGYYDRYGALPPEEAFLGFDIVSYFVPLLKAYGTGLIQKLEGSEGKQMHTHFAFERVVANGPAETTPPVDYFENKFVHILRFQNYRFQPADFR